MKRTAVSIAMTPLAPGLSDAHRHPFLHPEDRDGQFEGQRPRHHGSHPSGASCARVCRTEVLCAGAWVLSIDESPIRIGDLQRYVTDLAMESQVEPSAGSATAVGWPSSAEARRSSPPPGIGPTAMRLPFSRQTGVGEDWTRRARSRPPARRNCRWEAEQVIPLGVEVWTGFAWGGSLRPGIARPIRRSFWPSAWEPFPGSAFRGRI